MLLMVRRDSGTYLSRLACTAENTHSSQRIRALGPILCFRIADEMRSQVLSVYPDWPSREEREADLAHHVRLTDMLRRVGRLGGR